MASRLRSLCKRLPNLRQCSDKFVTRFTLVNYCYREELWEVQKTINNLEVLGRYKHMHKRGTNLSRHRHNVDLAFSFYDPYQFSHRKLSSRSLKEIRKIQFIKDDKL